MGFRRGMNCHDPCQTTVSFSSIVLDAIYRSMDDDRVAPAAPIVLTEEDVFAPPLKKRIALHHPCGYDHEKTERENMKKLPTQKSCLSSDSYGSSFSELAMPTASMKLSSYLSFPHITTTNMVGLPQASEQKKITKPVSPVARLASFLSSLTKKDKRSSSLRFSLNEEDSSFQKQSSTWKTKKQTSSTCSSSTSSFSAKSCLSNSSNGNGNSCHYLKRSIRFYPFTSIKHDKGDGGHLNKDILRVPSCPRGNEKDTNKFQPLQFNALSKYKNEIDFIMRDFHENQEKEDDSSSNCSSDLFELENLEGISMKQKYDEELPVYETTDPNMNLAIAEGLLLF